MLIFFMNYIQLLVYDNATHIKVTQMRVMMLLECLKRRGKHTNNLKLL